MDVSDILSPLNDAQRYTVAAESQNILGVSIVNESDPSTLLEGLEPDNVYVFTWTVTSDCGVTEDRVNVIISDPLPDAGVDTTACNDQGIWPDR